jgi:hypothetical protein
MRQKIIFIILVFTIGCDASNKERYTTQNIIALSDNELDKQYRASDIFADITLIPLETLDESIIGNVFKITIVDSIIYILDDKSMSLLLFDMQGHFITKVDRRGNGPNEYVYPEDFTVMKNKDILILDQNKKLLHFRNDGTPYKDYYLSFYADALEPINDTLIVFKGSSHEDRIIIWDIKNKKIEKSFIKYNDKHSGRISKPLIRYHDNIYFKNPLSSMIYKVTAEQLTEQWFIDYGKRNITDDKIVKIEYGIPVNYPYTMDMHDFTETKNYVMFTFQIEDLKDGMPYYVYYSKSTGKKIITIYDLHDNDMSFDFYPQSIFDATESGQVFEVLYPEYYLENISKYDTAAMNPETKQRWRYIKEQLKKMTEFDNPIVALYFFKDF